MERHAEVHRRLLLLLSRRSLKDQKSNYKDQRSNYKDQPTAGEVMDCGGCCWAGTEVTGMMSTLSRELESDEGECVPEGDDYYFRRRLPTPHHAIHEPMQKMTNDVSRHHATIHTTYHSSAQRSCRSQPS